MYLLEEFIESIPEESFKKNAKYMHPLQETHFSEVLAPCKENRTGAKNSIS
jgi:hypothetical protein